MANNDNVELIPCFNYAHLVRPSFDVIRWGTQSSQMSEQRLIGSFRSNTSGNGQRHSVSSYSHTTWNGLSNHDLRTLTVLFLFLSVSLASHSTPPRHYDRRQRSWDVSHPQIRYYAIVALIVVAYGYFSTAISGEKCLHWSLFLPLGITMPLSIGPSILLAIRSVSLVSIKT